MGGKHKQANRTKNNARPSSSSHSAELLGNTIPAFFGFSSTKDGVPAVSDEANYSINSDFQIMFKQMNKKDPTTRFKALQTFTNLCNTSDDNTVKAILPLWPRLYCTLCTDIDHKVREASHVAHRAVVSKVKKSIAPYLKEIAGPWFTSQYDTYAPAASAATIAFEEAFPSTKLNKAIMFCQEEILAYIYDNLINQTPQTLNNFNTTSPEDTQAKYERIIIASLQGYTLYLQKLSADQIQEAEESNKKLLCNPKFWKYGKNKVPLIRSCFFHTLIALCQNAKFLLSGESSRLSSAIFNNLDESDPIVLHVVWDAALNVLVSIEDCWTHINIEKQVFAKLSLVLKTGGRNVSTIYPNILPLLSKLPDDMIKDKEKFYGNLFDNIRTGFDVGLYNQANSDIKIVASTFVECLKYVVMRNLSDVEFCQSLVTNQLIPVLELKLNSNKAKKSTSIPFFSQTSSLIRYWYTNPDPTYQKIFENFFLSLKELYEKQLSSQVCSTTLNDILSIQIEFLMILLNPNEFLPKPKRRVTFEKETTEVETTITSESDVDFSNKILPFAKKLAALYFKNSINNDEVLYIAAISKIVEVFDAKAIFEEMVAAVNESTCFKLFTSYFSKWLMNQDLKCGELVDLSFRLLKYVTNDEKEYILDEFCNNWFSDTLLFNVCKALPNYSEDDCIMKWVRSEKFAGSILQLVEQFVKSCSGNKTSQDIILMLLKAKRANGEFIINVSTSDSIVDVVSKSLSQDEVKDHIVELSQLLILNVKNAQISRSSIEKLLVPLFKFWCYQTENENLIKACKAGLHTIIAHNQDEKDEFRFTKMLSEVVEGVIFSEEVTTEHLIDIINTYIELAINTNLSDSCSSNLEISNAMKIVKVFLDKKIDCVFSGGKMVERCCRIGLESIGDLDFEYLNFEDTVFVQKQDDHPDFTLNTVKKYAKWNLFLGSVLNLLAAAHPRSYKTSVLSQGIEAYTVIEDEETNTSTEYQTDLIPMKITQNELSKLENDLEIIESVFHEPEYEEENTIEPLSEDVIQFLVCVGLIESFCGFYASTEHYKELKTLWKKLKSTACDLLKNLNFIEFNFIYNQCKLCIRRKSLWWILKPTLKEIFNRNFLETFKVDEPKLAEECFKEFAIQEIKNLRKDRLNYLKLFCLYEKGYGPQFSESQFHSVCCFLSDFLNEFLNKSKYLESDLLVLLAVARLHYKLMKTFEESDTNPDSKMKMPIEMSEIWNQLVKLDLYSNFFSVWRKLTDLMWDNVVVPPEQIIVMQNLSDVIVAGFSSRRKEDVKESVNLEDVCGRLMTSPHAVVQITAFRVFLGLIPDFVKLDREMFGDQVTEMLQDTNDSSPLFKKSSNGDWIMKKLAKRIELHKVIVEALLSDFIVGDCCTVEPFTDSFTFTYSYLLLWCFILEMCGEAHSPLRFQYGCWLHEAGYSTTFLEFVFKLMPQTVLHGSESVESFRKYFESYGALDYREPIESQRIEAMACYVYRLFLQKLPNVVREWWNQVENKTMALVDKVTKLYVSPILITTELKNVQQDKETSFDNMEVKTYIGSREVVATYTIDEVKVDLIMTLPQNYPLGSIKVESSNIVASTPNWRNWLFHMSKYLIHQNGTIWDALVIWKNNLDKKFEGVEECYICFSILQGITFETPRLCCHTCKKKFHSNCLYKWFNTSNKSTCPICRNLF